MVLVVVFFFPLLSFPVLAVHRGASGLRHRSLLSKIVVEGLFLVLLCSYSACLLSPENGHTPGDTALVAEIKKDQILPRTSASYEM